MKMLNDYKSWFLLFVVCVSFGFGSYVTSENLDMKERKLSERIVDGCVYLEVDEYTPTGKRIYAITHKGNCPNKVHSCE